MVLAIECIVGCILMFSFCYINLGSDIKNLKSLDSYPDELQKLIRNDDFLKDKIKTVNPIIKFVSNLIMFTIILFIFGIFLREKGNYLYGFVGLLILGEVLNCFDFFIVDMFYFRYSKRSRFTNYPDQKLYMGLKNHFISFLKAIPMFAVCAAIDAAIIMLF